jgi:nitrite reductase/ring-hydroxylating ferredoxin subunit
MDFVRVASVEELDRAGSLKVIVGGKGVALFRVDGVIHAVQNACPHRGAPLAGAPVHKLEGGKPFVVCPDHAWRFGLEDGQCPEAGPECSLMLWDVKVEGGEILLSRLPRLA